MAEPYADPYANKSLLGAMVRDAAKAAVHNTDGPNDPDMQRLNNILACEAFVAALADRGCMVTRIPTAPDPPGGAMSDHPKCRWCGKNRKPSRWEQETIDGKWQRLCNPCADRRLDNPWNALLPMRQVSDPAAVGGVTGEPK